MVVLGPAQTSDRRGPPTRSTGANEGAESISRSNIAGGGGAEIPITGVDVNHPEGLAIDSAAGRIYWANRNDAEYSIRFANLDGSGGGILNTSPAPVFEPHGLAIYPAAGSIYWANWAEHKIYYAKLDGSGGGELEYTGALVEQPLGSPCTPPRTASTGRTSTGEQESTSRTSTAPAAVARST